jgi:hypothetical protein
MANQNSCIQNDFRMTAVKIIVSQNDCIPNEMPKALPRQFEMIMKQDSNKCKVGISQQILYKYRAEILHQFCLNSSSRLFPPVSGSTTSRAQYYKTFRRRHRRVGRIS